MSAATPEAAAAPRPGAEAERRVRFGIRLPPCHPAGAVAAFAGEVERAGFDAAWFPDSQFLFRDVWATMAVVAERTTSLRLGTAVTNFETRHVSVTAAAATTVAELAPGRVRVGVGTGETAVKTLGRPPTTVARAREGALQLRSLLDGETVIFDPDGRGPYARRRMRLHTTPAERVPIFLAATGPRMLQMAGGVADGVIMFTGVSADAIRGAVALVHKGAREAGRDPAEVELVLATHTAVADDVVAAARNAKPMVVQLGQVGGSRALEAIGISLEIPAVVDEVYPDPGHAEDWGSAVEHAGRWVTDEMAMRYASRYALVGHAESVVDRLVEAVGLGVTSFFILDFASYEMPSSLVAAFRDQIIPHVQPHEREAT